MSTVVQYGRREGSGKKVAYDPEFTTRLPDLRQVTVLPKAEWLRIEGSLHGVDRERELAEDRKREREALHQRSKDEVKGWSNSIAGQRQQKLEARKVREEIEEEEKKQVDLAEAQYQAERRREAIEQAKAQQYYQTDRVKRFHSALLLAEVLKERDAQLELKQKKRSATKDAEGHIRMQMEMEKEAAIHQDQQKALQRLLDGKAAAETLRQQIRERERAEELEKLASRREREDIRQKTQLFEWETREREQQRREEKRQIMKAHMEQLSNRDIIKAMEKQKQEEEEERIRCFSSAKRNMAKLRKEKEAELFCEVQRHKDRMVELLATHLQQKENNDDQLEREQKEKEEKRMSELKSISAHREDMRQQKEEKEKTEKLKALEMLHAKKAADKIFLEKQWEKEQKAKEQSKRLQELHVQQMAERQEKLLLTQKAQLLYDKQDEAHTIAEEQRFQEYAKEVIESAMKGQRNTVPLKKAAREGLGGGLGPVVGGVRPSYQVQDNTRVELPNYNRSTTQEIKEIYETGDIQLAKKRLGFTW
ncbi:CC173 protein, partial [Amia calva]|nr:CC173 protein [Amia calva]